MSRLDKKVKGPGPHFPKGPKGGKKPQKGS